jgi:hypothetical protein
MAARESSSSKMTRSERAGLLFDFWLMLGFVSLATGVFSGTAHWRPLIHLGGPLLILPIFLFLCHRFFGTSPGQYVAGIEFRLPSGGRASRLYDWFFSLRAKPADHPPGRVNVVVAVTAALVFTLGASFFLWMRDPTIRPFKPSAIALFAPDVKTSADWQVIPFFYATGAFPARLFAKPGEPSKESKAELSVEFGLPYEKGPPARFLGKITVYWRELDSRLTITGPLSVASPATPEKLRDCFSSWFRCLGDRRAIWRNSVSPHLVGRTVVEESWFTTENPFLAADERPQGIYVRTSADRGRIREAYFLVGPKMAIQSLILDRPARAEGELASETLRKIIGSLRLSGDLQAPRAFINPKLAALRIGPKSSLAELVAAEGYLLAKVSIEPKEAESFYHLGGLALTLFHAAKREGRIELAASSKTIVKSALKFARDVDPDSKRLREMEQFEVEVDAP